MKRILDFFTGKAIVSAFRGHGWCISLRGINAVRLEFIQVTAVLFMTEVSETVAAGPGMRIIMLNRLGT
jgi:hypothetical protein